MKTKIPYNHERGFSFCLLQYFTIFTQPICGPCTLIAYLIVCYKSTVDNYSIVKVKGWLSISFMNSVIVATDEVTSI